MNAVSQLDLRVGDNDPHNQVEQDTWDASWKEREQKCQTEPDCVDPKEFAYHISMHSLSWARLGARVTGVDFFDQAIAMARSLCQEVGMEAEFVCV
jgi:hypothetical protein